MSFKDKRLTKNRSNKFIAGVCAGIADYLEVDVTIVRLIWVVFGLLGGSGLLAYIIAALIIPNE